MHRLLLVIVVIGFCTPPVMAGQPSIRSKAELAHYLQQTPAGTSPLDELSPGGRKRFLAQLDFGERGLRGFSFDDPQNELTHPQIVQLFGLFGVEGYARGLGVSTARHAQLEQERIADAAARGCRPGHCPESGIEQAYDGFVLWKPAPAMQDAERFARIGQDYVRLFARHQSAEQLHTLSSPDLRLLTRAADHVVSFLPDPVYIIQLQIDLAEMKRRSMVEDVDYRGLYRALVSSREFTSAQLLADQHPGMDVTRLPVLRQSSPLPAGWPTVLAIGESGRSMRREAVDLSTGLRIVVVASCHFSQAAAHAIEADAQLQPLFAKHATWLASEGESFDAAADWNREFPRQPIHVAWRNSEWLMLDSWAMPTFYVFRDGRLSKRFSGWHDLQTLKQSLREAGALVTSRHATIDVTPD
ncbi:hypothetical protein [Rhodanobacter lindaniclasticus]